MVDSQELSALDNDALSSPDLVAQECAACFRILLHKFFDRDSSYKTGFKPICISCQAQPKLSMEEHLFRIKAQNFNSEALKKQRHEDQDEWRKEDARRGRTMHCSEFLMKLHRLVPSLYVQQGGLVGHLAMYLVSAGPRKDWEGRNFRYFGYVEFALLPEYTIFEFDDKRDVMIREDERGWRDILLRFIQAGLLSEEQADREFGKPSGQASILWFKKLYNIRNPRVAA